MEIVYDKEALKSLKRYDKTTSARIILGIQGLIQTPPAGDIRQLTGHNNLFRLRIGKYRVVYEYITQKDENDNPVTMLFISDIDSCGDIYRRF